MEVGEGAFAAVECLFADPDLVLAYQRIMHLPENDQVVRQHEAGARLGERAAMAPERPLRRRGV